jgi:hypothetical protein
VLELDEDERGFGDVGDPARAGGNVLQGGPSLGEQREAAFAEAAQRPDQGIAGPAAWLLPTWQLDDRRVRVRERQAELGHRHQAGEPTQD